jgi:hypothetical protein
MDDRDRMERRAPWVPWAITSLALVAVAAVAYSLGAHREAGALAAEPVRWHHSGFGGIWVFFLLFWVFGGLRWMWWGGRGYGPWYYGRLGCLALVGQDQIQTVQIGRHDDAIARLGDDAPAGGRNRRWTGGAQRLQRRLEVRHRELNARGARILDSGV